MLKLNNFKVEFSPVCKILDDELTFINPDIQWDYEQFCREVVDECWNKDEFSEEGYFALKNLFVRLILPKEHWNDIEYDKFYKIVLEKYRERLSEED